MAFAIPPFFYFFMGSASPKMSVAVDLEMELSGNRGKMQSLKCFLVDSCNSLLVFLPRYFRTPQTAAEVDLQQADTIIRREHEIKVCIGKSATLHYLKAKGHLSI